MDKTGAISKVARVANRANRSDSLLQNISFRTLTKSVRDEIFRKRTALPPLFDKVIVEDPMPLTSTFFNFQLVYIIIREVELFGFGPGV